MCVSMFVQFQTTECSARFERYFTALPVSLAMKTGHASETGMHDGFKVAGGRYDGGSASVTMRGRAAVV